MQGISKHSSFLLSPWKITNKVRFCVEKIESKKEVLYVTGMIHCLKRIFLLWNHEVYIGPSVRDQSCVDET